MTLTPCKGHCDFRHLCILYDSCELGSKELMRQVAEEKPVITDILGPGECKCNFRDREPDESMREWIKDCMCMYHWMETDYYQAKLEPEQRRWEQ